ncbi:xanthine dehydrogenase family protein molybdopterin-binding subunit [Alteromonas sp. a30]|uniref:xanthine dehydrogenase family protein molybdopterin-binding subunit n=1 Tax=Alteromonas sp. a30 TaxID=2730917 RepID=UPI002281C7E2|nr:xanthine dehydrogenase family protein molybdopterin-binding subunit [Alteromonas sp. a30]MCY7293924.1 xanthine dehydrogenase family protein molybdopterin-binding subunit [Alteromonas sp. a30]
MSEVQNVSRRDFLKLVGVSGSGLVLATTLGSSSLVYAAESQGNELNLFVSVEPDGTVNIVCHRSEMGQGIRTSLPQVVADEMEADWNKVKVIQGLADAAYGSQNTDGSRSVRRFYQVMREMGASARLMLEQAAAKTWQVAADKVKAENGFVRNLVSGEKLSFGQLSSIAATFDLPAKEQIKLKDSNEFRYIGKDIPIVDMRDIQTGKTVYGQDTQIEGMLYACIARSPVVGASVKSFDEEAAKAVKGVVGVWQLPDAQKPFVFRPLSGVAVVAENSWAAMEGRKHLNIQWSEAENQRHNSRHYLAELKGRLPSKGEVVRQRGNAYRALETADKIIEAEYTVPYLAHAPMEPPAATAVYKDGMVEVWACAQTPQSTQTNVAQALGLDPEKVKVNVTLLGGGFGRKSKPDFSVEAALLAKQFGKPVKLFWSREDDLQHCYYHAISAQRFEVGINSSGDVTSWVQRTSFPSISWTFTGTTDIPSNSELSLGFGDLPFNIPNLSLEKHKATAHARIGWIRSVSNIQHAFALGSFVDELATHSKKTPHEMWLELIGPDRIVDPTADGFDYQNYGESPEVFPIDTKRLKQVLNTVVEKSGANEQTEANEGWGICVHRSFVTYVAVAAKVKVVNGKVSILELHSAIDAGTVVNPDRVRSQQEGSMIFGSSIALMGEITFDKGQVEQSNYHDYPVMRMGQCPKIETYIIESDAVPGGVGEPGTPPVAPAIVNAIFHASGKRIRDLPINKHLAV